MSEGRDAAGKGGIIKAITEKGKPAGVPVVAPVAPSDREKSQIFLQRYIEQFPTGGEYVMGFCAPGSREREPRKAAPSARIIASRL